MSPTSAAAPGGELRLSCVDSAFPRLSHGAALDVIVDLGVGAVDLCVWAGYDHNPPGRVLTDPAREAERIGDELESRSLRLADIFHIQSESFDELAVNHPDEAVREESWLQFEGVVELARRLGSPGLTVLPGALFDGIDESESLRLAAIELERRAATAGEAGVRFSVEPHFRSVIATPARTATLLELTEQVELTLDLSHFIFQTYGQEEADPLLSRTRHVHLRQASLGEIQTRVAEGTIDFRALRDRLLAESYDGYFAVEYQWEEGWLDFTHVDCIAETAEMRDMMLGTS